MTQLSGFWTTSGTPTGHQQASYTQAHWSSAAKLFAACNNFEGIAPNYLNKLAGTVTGANTVQIDTGGGLVDGKWYYNDAAASVNIPSASGAGNTRIDRIVLRASWAGFAVTITRIAGVDATTPTAPAITQTSGTTYDIMLYQALVNTSGTVTLTDERVFSPPLLDGTSLTSTSGVISIKDLGVSTAKIAANAVAAGKLADGSVDTTARLANDIVDDTKVGNRVPQFYRRQGGSATDWSTQGTTTQTPTTVRMQAGVKRWTGASATSGNMIVTFPTAFSNPPIVFPKESGSVGAWSAPSAITATQFQLNWATQTGDNRTQIDFNWFAVGPE